MFDLGVEFVIRGLGIQTLTIRSVWTTVPIGQFHRGTAQNAAAKNLHNMLSDDPTGLMQRHARGERDRGPKWSLQDSCTVSGISPFGQRKCRHVRGEHL
jgi:hypothetical protein